VLTCFFSLQEIFGGNAVSDEYHIGRHVSNLFVTQTYEGQSDIHGKQMLSSRCDAELISL
jgi:glutaryl-CoA dehydrogenase